VPRGVCLRRDPVPALLCVLPIDAPLPKAPLTQRLRTAAQATAEKDSSEGSRSRLSAPGTGELGSAWLTSWILKHPPQFPGGDGVRGRRLLMLNTRFASALPWRSIPALVVAAAWVLP